MRVRRKTIAVMMNPKNEPATIPSRADKIGQINAHNMMNTQTIRNIAVVLKITNVVEICIRYFLKLC